MADRKWFWRGFWLGILALLFLTYYLTIGFSLGRHGSFYNSGHNAVWLGHEWVGEFKSEAEIRELVERLEWAGMDTIFVHSGPLDENGLVSADLYPYAKRFLRIAKAIEPKIEYQAWLGQIRSKIRLEEVEVRENVAASALMMVEEVGFDGIHYDVEPIWDEDMEFIDVLRLTREALPEAKISVAMAEFIPKLLIRLTDDKKEWQNYNSEVNYENVAKYADQIAVMVYDTRVKTDWLYRLLMREQVIWLSDLLEGKELFVGVPAYEDETRDSDPNVENLENALRGLTDGLNNWRSDRDNFAGVAIYAFWEISDDEWEVYDKYWRHD